VTKTTQDNVATFTVNGANIYKFLTAQELCAGEQCKFVKDFTGSATFQVGDPDTQSADLMMAGSGKPQRVTFLPDPRT